MGLVELHDGTALRREFVERRLDELKQFAGLYPATLIAILSSLLIQTRQEHNAAIELIVRHPKIEYFHEPKVLAGYDAMQLNGILSDFRELPKCLNNDPNDPYLYYRVEIDKNYAAIIINAITVISDDTSISISIEDPTKDRVLTKAQTEARGR